MRKILLSAMLTMSIGLQAQDFRFDEMTYTPEQTTFKLFAPADAKCGVVVGDETFDMQRRGDIWVAEVKGDLKGRFYEFVVNGKTSPGVFAKAVGVNGKKACVLDLRDTDPEGWESDHRLPTQSYADIIVYEMHHRDFSIARKDARHPGKFLALTEPWAIDHLKALGVNAVHILPSYDFGSVDETRLEDNKYNWGYDPVNYNVPEGSYSTDPYDPATRIREFKQMVQALHKAGIRVILDVVYNHTYDIDHSNFQRTYPDYYYRIIDNSDKTNHNSQFSILNSKSYSNGSGCGNETASEQPMMRRFMIESVKHWTNEYHIDGFRFDLMGVHDIATMNAIREALDEIDPQIFIYGEGWSAGSCGLPNEQLGMKANISQMPRIAAFSDEIRDALRGPFDNDTKPGILGGAPNMEESLKFGIVGAIAHPQIDMSKVNYSKQAWATDPTQMMAYVSCHDDMCLVDRLKASVPGITQAELIRLDLLAQTAVFTSQGVPFMLSGEELLRDKKGVHNSYESPDSINHLEWSNMERYPQVFEYYKNLISLRKNHPAFRLGNAEMVRRYLEFIDAPAGVVAFRLKDYAGSDSWRNIIVVLNASAQKQAIDIPQGKYTVVCRDGVISEKGLGTVKGKKIKVSPQSATIIHD
ncbi:MAG: type I pullulanase [Prevotella sp.]|nr:type I pullulanase [Prevotella sp.]